MGSREFFENNPQQNIPVEPSLCLHGECVPLKEVTASLLMVVAQQVLTEGKHGGKQSDNKIKTEAEYDGESDDEEDTTTQWQVQIPNWLPTFAAAPPKKGKGKKRRERY